MLLWPNGLGIRIGTRSDGTLQSDVYGQQAHGGEYDVRAWVWLRARWLARSGVIECSHDGKSWDRLRAFEHNGAALEKTAELLVGKVPYNGEPKDHSEPGNTGHCAIDLVRVY